MADLDDHTRRLIDDAVAAGKVTSVPRGVSGLPQLRYVEGHGLIYPTGSWKDRAKSKPGAHMARKAAQVRGKVALMAQDGHDREAIAASLGLAPSTVDKHARRAGVELDRTTALEKRRALEAKRKAERAAREPVKSPKMLELEARRREVKALIDEGLSQRAIAERTGLPLHVVVTDWRALGAVSKKARPPACLVEDRRARLAELHAAGSTAKDAATALGVHIDTVRKDIKELGLKWKPDYAAAAKKRLATMGLRARA